MKRQPYLLDTHALVFFAQESQDYAALVQFLDVECSRGRVFVSSISFWEISLLISKGRLSLKADLQKWSRNVLEYSGLHLWNPTYEEMIQSSQLPPIHKDPFDRLLVAQSLSHKAMLVSKDSIISEYPVKCFWV